MSFSDELLGFWSKPKRQVFIAQWEQGLSELRINAFSTIEKHEEIDFTHDSSVENLQYFFSQASLYSIKDYILDSINIFAAFIKLEFESRQNNHSDFSFTIII